MAGKPLTVARLADIVAKVWAGVLFITFGVCAVICLTDISLFFEGAAVAMGVLLLIGLILQPVTGHFGAGKLARRLLLISVLCNLALVALFMVMMVSVLRTLAG